MADTTTLESYLSMVRQLNVRDVAIGVGLLLIGLIGVRLLLKLVGRALKRTSAIPISTHTMLKTILRILLDVIVVLIAASYMGIPVTSLIALLSVIGIAVSLAVQGILSNLVGGFIILISKPFLVDDYIESDGVSGTVRDISVLHTRLLTLDGKEVFIPNSLLYTSRLINYTQHGTRRADLEFTVSYDDPPEKVRAAGLAAAASMPEILKDPPPVVQLDSFGDSGIKYVIRAWCSNADFGTVRFGLNEKLYAAFRSHGVTMTYPHLNVHFPDAPERSR